MVKITSMVNSNHFNGGNNHGFSCGYWGCGYRNRSAIETNDR